MSDDEQALKDAIGFVLNEQEQIGMEGIFTLAVRLGVMLNKWAEMMWEGNEDGQFSKEWVEVTAMTIFHKFFTPGKYE